MCALRRRSLPRIHSPAASIAQPHPQPSRVRSPAASIAQPFSWDAREEVEETLLIFYTEARISVC